MKNQDLQRIFHQTENELSTFRNELNKLSVSNYPTELGNTIIDELRSKTEQYEQLLKNIMEDVDEGEQDQIIITQCKEKITTSVHVPLVSQDIKFLNWLYKAQTRKVPWSFINCIEELGKQILPDKSILVCCDDRYNYEICWANNIKVAPYKYYVISLPLLHRTNILLHSLIGHELFHPICSDFIDKYNKKILTEIRDEVEKDPQKFLPDKKDDSTETLFSRKEKEGLLLAISDTIHFAWKRGLEEILCDMACVEMFGPAALFAMRAFSAYSAENSTPEPSSNFYPSWQYRLEIVWDKFIDESKAQYVISAIPNKEIADSFKREFDKIKNIVEKKEGDSLVKRHKHARVAYEKIDKVLDKAVEFVKDALSVKIEKWHNEEVISQISELVQRLDNGIPPNEVNIKCSSKPGKEEYFSKAAFLPAILNAGWIYESYWQEMFNNSQGSIMDYKTMSRLLLKACEDIDTVSQVQNVSPNQE